MRFSLLFLIAFFVGGLAPGAAHGQQSRCDHPLRQSPKVRGVGLGITIEELSGELPRLLSIYKRALNDMGEAFTITLPIEDDPKRFDGIAAFRASFLDGRVSFFSIDYKQFTPDSVNDFAAQVSQTLGLPKAWRRFDSGGLEMRCDGFTVSVVYGGVRPSPPSLIFFDTGAAERLRQRRLKHEREKARQLKIFKP